MACEAPDQNLVEFGVNFYMALFAAVERSMNSTACLGRNKAFPVFKAGPSASAGRERGDRLNVFGVLQPRDVGRMKCGITNRRTPA